MNCKRRLSLDAFDIFILIKPTSYFYIAYQETDSALYSKQLSTVDYLIGAYGLRSNNLFNWRLVIHIFMFSLFLSSSGFHVLFWCSCLFLHSLNLCLMFLIKTLNFLSPDFLYLFFKDCPCRNEADPVIKLTQGKYHPTFFQWMLTRFDAKKSRNLSI